LKYEANLNLCHNWFGEQLSNSEPTTSKLVFIVKMGIMKIMNVKEQLQNSLKDAMRSGDTVRKSTLRMALSAIQLAEVEKRGQELDDTAMLAILQKEIKSRNEAIQDAEKAGRPDLIDASKAEVEVLKGFLPEQLSQDEWEELARQVIEEVNATDMRSMGQVMKVLMPRLGGRATGNQASQTVRKLLS
jgi:hypothetical protein